MLNRLSLFAWLVSLEALDAEPARHDALRRGFELAQLAVTERLLDASEHAHGDVARLLAELESDGWIAWDWIPYGSDPRPEQPPATTFDDPALRRVRNIRVRPEGYAAFAARQGLGGADPSVGGDTTASRPGGPRYDLFISHASEDKPTVARPLADVLDALGFAVWYDEEQIEIGSSLRASVEAGLAASRYGIVVLSRAFFDKPWPQKELDGLFAREMAVGEEVILPLWHEIDVEFLASKAPMMLNRFALNTALGIPELADRLSRRLRRQRGRDNLRARLGAPPPPPSATGSDSSETRVGEGETNGVATRRQMIEMLRAHDDVGMRELSRHEQRAFEERVVDVLQDAGDRFGSSADPEALRPVEQALWGSVDRRLGSLLPLIEYRPEVLGSELRELTAFAGRPTPTRAPYAAWVDGPRWPVWLITLILGTTAITFDRPEVAVALWARTASYDDDRPLPVARLGGGAELGGALLRARPATASAAIELWYPAFSVFDSDLLREHYPEIMCGGNTPDAVLGFLSRAGDFLWLCGALAGRDGIEVIRFWQASQVHPTLPQRLQIDRELRERYAAALGVETEGLSDTLAAWHAKVSGPRL